MLYDENLLNGEQAKIDECYTQIGLRYYAYHKDNPAPEFADLIAAINYSKQIIAAHKAEVLRANGKIVCPNCGQQINANVLFCTCCGLRIQAPAPAAPVAAAAPAPAPVAAPVSAPAAPSVPEMPKPHFEAPVAEQPVAEEPVVEEPVVEQPVVEEPVVEEPVVEEPVVEEPVVEEPVVEEPVAEEPVVEEPVAEEPAAPEQRVCRVCGAPILPDCLFCIECGTRVEEEKPAQPEPHNVYSYGGARVCKNCGYPSNESDAIFCNNCGSRLEEAFSAAPSPVMTGKHCPNCGFSTTEPDMMFCIECGTKLI